MAETRRKFDSDFREGAVRLVRETGKRPRERRAAGRFPPRHLHLAMYLADPLGDRCQPVLARLDPHQIRKAACTSSASTT